MSHMIRHLLTDYNSFVFNKKMHYNDLDSFKNGNFLHDLLFVPAFFCSVPDFQ